MKYIHIDENPFSRFLFSSTKMAWLWLIVRVYVGWQWLEAGWEKIHNAAWVGPSAGAALSGFVKGALAKTAGAHPDVQGWYASFLQNMVLPHASAWAHAVAWGEVLVGVALVIGALTGIAAFFGHRHHIGVEGGWVLWGGRLFIAFSRHSVEEGHTYPQLTPCR